MTSDPESRDTELGQAIRRIAVPELPHDFLARTAALALGGSPQRRRILAVAATTHAPAPASAASPVLAFAPASDWNSVVAPLPGKLQTNNEVVAWAGNVPFQGDDLASGWPTDTVERLPADGVVVFASLAHTVDDPQTYPAATRRCGSPTATSSRPDTRASRRRTSRSRRSTRTSTASSSWCRSSSAGPRRRKPRSRPRTPSWPDSPSRRAERRRQVRSRSRPRSAPGPCRSRSRPARAGRTETYRGAAAAAPARG